MYMWTSSNLEVGGMKAATGDEIWNENLAREYWMQVRVQTLQLLLTVR